jgi:hypothetical protein
MAFVAVEADDGGVATPDHLRDEEDDVDPRVGERAADRGAEAGPVVALDEQARELERPQPRGVGGAGALLPGDREDLDRRARVRLGIAVAHHEPQIRAGTGERLERRRQHARLVLDLAAPEGDPFHGERHRSPP